MEAGWLPKTYAVLANDIAQQLNAYGQATATLISAALTDAFTWRATFGWRPFDPIGLEFFGGYTLTAFGGNAVAGSLISEATGQNLPAQYQNQDVALRSDLHSFHVGLGYRQRIGDFSLQIALAYLQSFASTSSIDLSAPDARDQAVIDAASTALDSYLGDFYSRYFKLPVLSVFIGYYFL
ncbi:MAG: hypothetical protein IPJ88_12595 [Myxococcales bacterium]|nr:MAG: hypothetical protein IPJ88_12595 [Myxococcales bacterium]